MTDLTRDYVLRALAASEIADGCLQADLRARFTELAQGWLTRAAEAAWPNSSGGAVPEAEA